MAIWVNLNRAAKFPEVVKVYSRAGQGQGSVQSPGATVPPQAAKGFLATVRKFVTQSNGAALPAWIRKSPLGTNDWQDVQVNVQAIPGVRRLNVNGKWYRYDQF